MVFLLSAKWAPTLPGTGHSRGRVSFSDAAFDQANPFLMPPSYEKKKKPKNSVVSPDVTACFFPAGAGNFPLKAVSFSIH